MDEQKLLAERFEANRAHLRGVAYRLLGSRAEAEDAVQEAWLRLSRSEADELANLRGWLTTVTARVCLDMLRSRKARREDAAPMPDVAAADDAAHEQAMADSVGLALLVVLETLAPAERIAFVLHDMFDVPFEEIAPIVGRSEPATRQMASRARRRVRGGDNVNPDRERQREVVSAFLAASRANDFNALLAVLDPNVVLRADAAAVAASLARGGQGGGPDLKPFAQGAHVVAETFKGRARAARLALIDGEFGLTFAPGGTPFSVFLFTLSEGRVTELRVVVDPERLAAMDVEFLS